MQKELPLPHQQLQPQHSKSTVLPSACRWTAQPSLLAAPTPPDQQRCPPDSWGPTVPRPSQLPASLPNLGACNTHHTLTPAWTHLQCLLAFFSVLSRESWKARPPHVQLWSGSEEKSSTSPFSGFPRALLLTWRAWWLVLDATPLNLHSPNPNKRSVSGRVSTPWQPWTLGGAEGGTLHWSLQQRLWEPLPGLLISQPRQKGREPAASRGRRRGGPV